MSSMFDAIEMVSERSKPTFEQINFCVKSGLYDMDVSKESVDDWYCLLFKIQGDLFALNGLVNSEKKGYMIDKSSFIKDSLLCEYAYIINLDTHMLEFWVGCQKKNVERQPVRTRERRKILSVQACVRVPAFQNGRHGSNNQQNAISRRTQFMGKRYRLGF